MRLLLDTQAFLRWIAEEPALPVRARRALSDAGNEVLVSTASAWELAIKVSIGKLRLARPVAALFPEQLALNGFSELPISFRHVAAVEKLPFHHRDPFDRLLICQAQAEALTIVSGDESLDAYAIRRLW